MAAMAMDNVVTNQLSLSRVQRDTEREIKDRRFQPREVVVDYDQPELRVAKPGRPKPVLNGGRCTELAVYDERVLAYVDELLNREQLDYPTLVLWYRQAFSKQIRAAKSVRKAENPKAKNCASRTYVTVSKEYAVHVFSYTLEDPPEMMNGMKTVPEIMKSQIPGKFSEVARRQVLAHTRLAKEAYSPPSEPAYDIVEGTSSLNGANGEATGSDDVSIQRETPPEGYYEGDSIERLALPEFSNQLSKTIVFEKAPGLKCISTVIFEHVLEPYIDDVYDEATTFFVDLSHELPTPMIAIDEFFMLNCRLPCGAMFLFHKLQVYMFLNINQVPAEYMCKPRLYDFSARCLIQEGCTVLCYNLAPCLGGSKKKQQPAQKKMKQKQNTIKGSGAYSFGDLTKMVKKMTVDAVKKVATPDVGERLGGALGKAVGGRIGFPDAGASLGAKLGKHVARLIGSGDYETNAEDVSANSLINGKVSPSASFGSATHTTRVRHREYVQDLSTGDIAGQFSNQVFSLNPANAQLFPYLSQLAQNYEKYAVHGFVVELVSTTSPYNSNSAMGSVIVTATFNSAVAPFVTKNAMENSEEAVSARFDRNLCYGLECKDSATKEYYIDNGNTVDNSYTSPQLLNFCNLQLATAPASTFPTASVVYEMWITYDISLIGPKISPARYGVASWLSSNVTATNLIGTPVQFTGIGNATSFLLSYTAANSFTLSFSEASVGNLYMFQYTAGNASVTLPSITMGVLSNDCSLGYANVIGKNGTVNPDTYGTGPNGLNFVYTYFFTTTCDNGDLVFETTCGALSGPLTATVKLICLGNGYPNFPLDGSI